MKLCGLFVPSNFLESVQTCDNYHKQILSLLPSYFLAFIKRSRIVLKKMKVKTEARVRWSLNTKIKFESIVESVKGVDGHMRLSLIHI